MFFRDKFIYLFINLFFYFLKFFLGFTLRKVVRSTTNTTVVIARASLSSIFRVFLFPSIIPVCMYFGVRLVQVKHGTYPFDNDFASQEFFLGSNIPVPLL